MIKIIFKAFFVGILAGILKYLVHGIGSYLLPGLNGFIIGSIVSLAYLLYKACQYMKGKNIIEKLLIGLCIIMGVGVITYASLYLGLLEIDSDALNFILK